MTVKREEPLLPGWVGAKVISIPITRGMMAIVDYEDADKVVGLKWQAVRRSSLSTFYARRTVQKNLVARGVFMHSVIMDSDKRIDHINGNGLDNRKSNLRFVTHSQNRMNSRKGKNKSSRFKGVCWSKRDGKWLAAIHVAGKCIGLKTHAKEEDAARAYDKAALKFFGEYACTNKEALTHIERLGDKE